LGAEDDDNDGEGDGAGKRMPPRPRLRARLDRVPRLEGINDVNGSRRGGADVLGRLYGAVTAMYGALLRGLHAAAGARNFVLLTVPPVGIFNQLARRMAGAFVEDVGGGGGGEDGGERVGV